MKYLLAFSFLFTNLLFAQEQSSNTIHNQVYVIPVVFHVLHEYGTENISRAQILDAMRILNEDFRKRNADTVDIIPVFKPIAADCEIEFRLATLDPNGNCTDGVERIVTPWTFIANDSSKLHPWPNDKYLNIWVANSLDNISAWGYTHLPGGADSVDGVMMWHMYVGSIGTSSPANSRALTHEVGHYLNLLHLWGCNLPNDHVDDTPPTNGATSCDLTLSVCNPPVIENVQNFMEYSFCTRMFTNGQKARMDTALNSAMSHRNNLWTSANLIATGTDVPPVASCAPIADFNAIRHACIGQPISFAELGWNAPVTSREWSFPGGIPSTSIDSNPSVTYNAAGLYDVTLIVTNSTGTDTITKAAYIQITDSALTALPFSCDFENPASFPGIDGWIENRNSDSVLERTSAANTTPGGTWSLTFNDFTTPLRELNSWVTPSLNFSTTAFPIRIEFNVAYAQKNTIDDDQLSLYYSTDCGYSWQATSYSKNGITLATAPVTNGLFIPANNNQWRHETVICNAVQLQPNVRFKFENASHGGNNIYIDDLMINGSAVGIDDETYLPEINIYPNPTSDRSVVSFELSRSANLKCTISNTIGQQIELITGKGAAGLNEILLPRLAPGIYFIELTLNDRRLVRRLTVCHN